MPMVFVAASAPGPDRLFDAASRVAGEIAGVLFAAGVVAVAATAVLMVLSRRYRPWERDARRAARIAATVAGCVAGGAVMFGIGFAAAPGATVDYAPLWAVARWAAYSAAIAVVVAVIVGTRVYRTRS